ncbi:G2/mitotic-specific cyclin-B-like [Rhodnius prolixus]|uniref:G2/mitotic-specific cyclin-B3 n=1 Tax=Rhodnius prolixus TaxID=13249 RepID=T1I8W3_RHOPR
MPTQTRQLNKQVTTNKQTGLENHGVITTKSKLPVIIKRNALVEINNINVSKNQHDIHINNKIKLNTTNAEKAVVEIHESVQIKKKQSDETVVEKKESKENINKNIEDIDKFYKNNLFLASDYAEDIYEYLRALEMKYKIKKWPLNSNVNEKMRGTLIDWLVDVQVEYELLQESLHLAVSLIDRFIQISSEVNAKNFQLIGVCCMAIAAKFEEVQPLSVSDFLYLCNNAYNINEFRQMEAAILSTLDFQIARPLSISFLRRYSLAGRAERRQHIYAKYILDLVLLEPTLCHVKPSLIAASACFISLCITHGNFNPSHWTDQLIYYSKYSFNSLKPFIGRLSRLVLDSRKHLRSVKNKYALKEFEFVSNRIVLKTNLLRILNDVKPHG